MQTYTPWEPIVGGFSRWLFFTLALPLLLLGFFGMVGLILQAGFNHKSSSLSLLEEAAKEDLTQPDTAPIFQRLAALRKMHAVTDRGRPVKLYHAVDANLVLSSLSSKDEAEARALASNVIRVSAPDESTNCFGWIFTDGAYWIYGTSIVDILEDNDYHEIRDPQRNDLAVYRDRAGEIVHCGLVRMVTEDGLIVIESKWAWLGRFLHPPDWCPYGSRCAYYRTTRPRHGLEMRSAHAKAGPPQSHGSRDSADH